MKQVLIVEDQRMPRKYMERMISDSETYALAGVCQVKCVSFLKNFGELN